jgi:hypothetical protein
MGIPISQRILALPFPPPQPPIPIIRNDHHPHLASPAFPQMRKMGFGGQKESEVGGAIQSGTTHVYSARGMGGFD